MTEDMAVCCDQVQDAEFWHEAGSDSKADQSEDSNAEDW